MAISSVMSQSLRRSLLLKIISNSTPTKKDVDSIVELTSSKVVCDLKALSMTLYLVEGNEIAFKYVYFSPTLWANGSATEKQFEEKKQKLLAMRLPLGTGLVGKVIATGTSNLFCLSKDGPEGMLNLSKNTDFEVTSMITVPLKSDNRVIGAIQVLNKEPNQDEKEFTDTDRTYLEEVAEYTSSLLLRILDPNFEINEEDTARYIANFTDTPLITDDSQLTIEDSLLSIIGPEIIRKTNIFPYKYLSGDNIAVLVKNPLDYQSREFFSSKTQLQIEEVYVATPSLIEKLLKKYYHESKPTQENEGVNIEEITNIIGAQYNAEGEEAQDSGKESDSYKETDTEQSAPIIMLANRIIEDAYFCGASDIHIEPQEKRLFIRYRIDGLCIEKLDLPAIAAGPLVARIKIMCDLDIAQKRLPQDGRIAFTKFTKKKINIDLRVATCPSLFGEKVVMRILDKSKSALPITNLGFSEENLLIYRKMIRYPFGMILHCGPTGSGKSMTLFSALREIASPEINVQTAEDPIEYTIPGINQVQMHRAIGLTFASTLRSFLRMDPDVILLGEIRDKETAEIAIEAALTGHLLLSTMHTNDAPSTIARFTDMEIEPFMVSSSLLVVCAQRLMRKVCSKCRVTYKPEANESEILMNSIKWTGDIYKANEYGCPACGGMGMKGRIGIHELMQNNDELTRAINRNADTATLKVIAMQTGMKTLHQDSMLKVKNGVTSLLEAISVVPPDSIQIEKK